MSGSLPTITLIVLNWNGRQHLEACLASLEALDYPRDRLQLILFDNGSTDGSADFVTRRFPGVELIRSKDNRGFAGANNDAAGTARGDWVGFLNNDMRVEPGWLTDLLGGLVECPGAACLSSRILSWDGTRVDFVGGEVNYEGHGYQPGFGGPVDAGAEAGGRRLLFGCGGAMLVKRVVFEELGGFDADFFAYFEDIDLGWRLNLLGHDVWYTPRATAYHHHHSTGRRIAPQRIQVLYQRNALATVFKCLDDENLAAALPAAILLLNERALINGHVSREGYHSGPRPTHLPAATIPAERPGPARRAARILGEEGIGAVLRHTAAALRRRLAGALLPASARNNVNDPVAIAHYVALSEFTNSLEALTAKRRQVQASRVRSDAEVLALAGDMLHPSFEDPPYLALQALLNTALGLDSRFGRPAR